MGVGLLVGNTFFIMSLLSGTCIFFMGIPFIAGHWFTSWGHFYNESSFWGMHFTQPFEFIIGRWSHSWVLVYLSGDIFRMSHAFLSSF